MTRSNMNIGQTLKEAQNKLESATDSPLLDCQLLLAHVLGKSREWLIAHSDDELDATQVNNFQELVRRRQTNEPVAYITGCKGFWNREFAVTPDVLVPRPETELLVELLLERLGAEEKRVVDLGTGSGAIAVSLAAERPDWQVIGIDQSDAAIEVADDNAKDLTNIEIRAGNWCQGIEAASCDAIVSNPPYVRENDAHLQALEHEPITALASGPDGLDAIRHIVPEAYRCLKSGGILLTEHGYDQQSDVIELFRQAGFKDVAGITDLNNVPRAVLGYRA